MADEDRDYDLPLKLWKSRNAIVTRAARAYHKLCKRNYVFTMMKKLLFHGSSM